MNSLSTLGKLRKKNWNNLQIPFLISSMLTVSCRSYVYLLAVWGTQDALWGRRPAFCRPSPADSISISIPPFPPSEGLELEHDFLLSEIKTILHDKDLHIQLLSAGTLLCPDWWKGPGRCSRRSVTDSTKAIGYWVFEEVEKERLEKRHLVWNIILLLCFHSHYQKYIFPQSLKLPNHVGHSLISLDFRASLEVDAENHFMVL